VRQGLQNLNPALGMRQSRDRTCTSVWRHAWRHHYSWWLHTVWYCRRSSWCLLRPQPGQLPTSGRVWTITGASASCSVVVDRRELRQATEDSTLCQPLSSSLRVDDNNPVWRSTVWHRWSSGVGARRARSTAISVRMVQRPLPRCSSTLSSSRTALSSNARRGP